MSALTRDLVYRILADTSGLDKGARSAERQLATLERRQRMVDQAMTRVGRSMVIAGAAIAGGLVVATRAAIEWEASWAGVAKVLSDATEPQLAILEGQLRGLARELPQTHAEIAQVASAAGQLGVAAPDIAEFTRTMVDLGVATNLTSQEAAFAIARMSNIMGTMAREGTDGVRRLGSTIVELGNNSATTEQDITQMALRIAGAGTTIGMSEAEVLSFSAALSSVGIRAEAGGSAISRAFISIEGAVRQGGDQLEKFAEVAGVSAEDFRRSYQDNAAQGIASFVAGLGRIQQSGGDVFKTLQDLGFTEIRLRDALLRLASAGDLLSDSLATGARGWDENVALMNEAERRYGTVEARMGRARNQLNDFAIDIGQTFLPVVGKMADTLGAFADVLSDLPGPIKMTLGILAAATAAVLLLGGAALMAVPRIAAMRQSLDMLAAASFRGAVAVGVFRAAASFLMGPWGIALGLAVAAVTAFGVAQAHARQRVRELSQTLDQQTGAVTDNTRAWVANELEQRGVLRHAQEIGIDLATLTDAILGEADALHEVRAATDRYIVSQGQRAALATDLLLLQTAYEERLIAQGVAEEEAARRGREYTDVLIEQHRAAAEVQRATRILTGEVDEAIESQERQADAIGRTTDATERMTPETRRLAEALDLTTDEAEGLAGAVSDLSKELKALFDQVFGLSRAQDALTEKLREATDQFKASEEGLDGNSEAAIRNRRTAEDLLETYGELVLKTLEHTGSQEEAEKAAGKFQRQLDKLEEQTGLNIRELEGYNDVVAEIDRLIEVQFENVGATEAEREARNLAAAIDSIDREVNVRVNVSQAGRLPGDAGPSVAHKQHGGEVLGPAGIDAVPARLTAGEIVIRRSVAQADRGTRDALLAFNRTGRLPVGLAAAGGGAGGVVHNHFTTNVNARTVDLGPRELEAAQAKAEARLRVGRPS